MKRCPITYELISEEESYSRDGLRLLSPKLKNLQPLDLTAEQQRLEAIARVGKMSVQGVQKKLSAQLKVTDECFEIVDQFGHYILKPQSSNYMELPENEALTMSLAKMTGIEVPVHGLVYSKDNSMTYFIKRFDRLVRNKKLSTEDFSQLSGFERATKYDSSMEQVIKVVESFCSFPRIEFVKLFKLTIFNFLIGNEDMHLKNFSLITRGKIITLSPAYDLLNTTIVLKNSKEELALPLRGKKNNLSRRDFLDYFAIERLGIKEKIVGSLMQEMQQVIPQWKTLINISFLSTSMKEKYIALLEARCRRLDLD